MQDYQYSPATRALSIALVRVPHFVVTHACNQQYIAERLALAITRLRRQRKAQVHDLVLTARRRR